MRVSLSWLDVGFIKKLPHHLVHAFKSTLELAVKSDLILNVCDGSGNWQRELEVTIETLEKELEQIEIDLFGEAATDYKKAAELTAKKDALEERLMEIYEELE